MKKVIVFTAVISAVVVLSGCAMSTEHTGFPSVAPGALYADLTTANYLADKTDKDFKIVKRGVTATASTVNYLGMVSLGDCSLSTLKASALKSAPSATDLVDVQVDANIKNILGIILTVETRLTGTAVRY